MKIISVLVMSTFLFANCKPSDQASKSADAATKVGIDGRYGDKTFLFWSKRVEGLMRSVSRGECEPKKEITRANCQLNKKEIQANDIESSLKIYYAKSDARTAELKKMNEKVVATWTQRVKFYTDEIERINSALKSTTLTADEKKKLESGLADMTGALDSSRIMLDGLKRETESIHKREIGKAIVTALITAALMEDAIDEFAMNNPDNRKFGSFDPLDKHEDRLSNLNREAFPPLFAALHQLFEETK